jgi:hypothetical protein
MAELVDVLRLERSAARRAGSNPVLGTKKARPALRAGLAFLVISPCFVSVSYSTKIGSISG